MYNFDYTRPSSLDEALKALSTGDEVKLMAGGQTLIPTLKQRLAQPGKLIDLSGIAELKGIKIEGNAVVIGAMTPHAAVADSADVKAKIPALASLAHGIGDPQVRNRGTLGGSISNNDPAPRCTPANGSSQPRISSTACSRPCWKKTRSSRRSPSRSRRKRPMRNSPSPPAAMRWLACSSPGLAMAFGWR